MALADLGEQQKLFASITNGAHSGTAVSIFGDTAVVGAPDDNGGTGSVHVLTRAGAIWTDVATLTASDGLAGDRFGAAVSISNGNIAVGAPGRNSNAGAVYTFTGGGASWTQNATVLVNATTPGGRLGSSVSIQGFRVAAGAPTTAVNGRPNVGVAIAFNSNDSGVTWTRFTFHANGGQARSASRFGTSVALSGSTIAVGAPGYQTGNKANSGTMFIFVNNGGSWTQQANLRPSNTANFLAGTSVGLSSNTAAVGTPGAVGGKGAVYVYSRSGTTWTPAGTLTASDGVVGDQFGGSVSVSGPLILVGAPAANSAGGKSYEFGLVGGNYVQANALVASDNAAGDNFGASVGFDAGSAIVGSPLNDNNAATDDGAAYVFVIQQASVTTITGFITDGDFATASLTGVPYSVFVHVDHDVGGSGTPTGSVDLDDGFGGTCSIAALDGSGNGSCTLTSNHFGSLTMTASYNGDITFSPSTGTHSHDITGNHLVFNPAPPNVLQGEQVSNVVVEVHDGANALITGDGTTQVTLTVDDTCGNLGLLVATQTVVGGVTTFTGVGPKFYTVTGFGGALGITASANDGSVSVSTNFDVLLNPDLVYADGFEDCRL